VCVNRLSRGCRIEIGRQEMPFRLMLQVQTIPEEDLIQKLARHSPDKPLDEGMGARHKTKARSSKSLDSKRLKRSVSFVSALEFAGIHSPG
jgi:hypothetical protein